MTDLRSSCQRAEAGRRRRCRWRRPLRLAGARDVHTAQLAGSAASETGCGTRRLAVRVERDVFEYLDESFGAWASAVESGAAGVAAQAVAVIAQRVLRFGHLDWHALVVAEHEAIDRAAAVGLRGGAQPAGGGLRVAPP